MRWASQPSFMCRHPWSDWHWDRWEKSVAWGMSCFAARIITNRVYIPFSGVGSGANPSLRALTGWERTLTMVKKDGSDGIGRYSSGPGS